MSRVVIRIHPLIDPQQAFQYQHRASINTVDLEQISDEWLNELTAVYNAHYPEQGRVFDRHLTPLKYSQYKSLTESLKCVYYHLQKNPDITETLKTQIVIKLNEGVRNCPPGFHNRVNEILETFSRASTFLEILTQVRIDLVNRAARSLTDGVHAFNRFRVVAEDNGLGVEPINRADEHVGALNKKTIQIALEKMFLQEYTPFRIPFLIEEHLRSICDVLGTAPQEDGYTFSEYKAIGTALDTILGLKTEEDAPPWKPYFNFKTKPGPAGYESTIYESIDWRNIRRLVFAALFRHGIVRTFNVAKAISNKTIRFSELPLLSEWCPNYSREIAELVVEETYNPDFILRNAAAHIKTFFSGATYRSRLYNTLYWLSERPVLDPTQEQLSQAMEVLRACKCCITFSHSLADEAFSSFGNFLLQYINKLDWNMATSFVFDPLPQSLCEKLFFAFKNKPVSNNLFSELLKHHSPLAFEIWNRLVATNREAAIRYMGPLLGCRYVNHQGVVYKNLLSYALSENFESVRHIIEILKTYKNELSKQYVVDILKAAAVSAIHSENGYVFYSYFDAARLAFWQTDRGIIESLLRTSISIVSSRLNNWGHGDFWTHYDMMDFLLEKIINSKEIVSSEFISDCIGYAINNFCSYAYGYEQSPLVPIYMKFIESCSEKITPSYRLWIIKQLYFEEENAKQTLLTHFYEHRSEYDLEQMRRSALDHYLTSNCIHFLLRDPVDLSKSRFVSSIIITNHSKELDAFSVNEKATLAKRLFTFLKDEEETLEVRKSVASANSILLLKSIQNTAASSLNRDIIEILLKAYRDLLPQSVCTLFSRKDISRAINIVLVLLKNNFIMIDQDWEVDRKCIARGVALSSTFKRLISSLDPTPDSLLGTVLEVGGGRPPNPCRI